MRNEEAALRAAGQRIVIVIASDGAATDGDIAAAMKPLQTLPVWVVVRLCTDDDQVRLSLPYLRLPFLCVHHGALCVWRGCCFH